LNAYLNAYWVVIKMENFNTYGEQNGDLGVQYPKGDGNGGLSGASIIQKDDREAPELPEDATKPCGITRPKTRGLKGFLRWHGATRGYCAIGMESKVAEDGRQALEHIRTERVVVYSLGETDIQAVRMALASYGIYAANMVDGYRRNGYLRS
jgi:hypothetical protein